MSSFGSSHESSYEDTSASATGSHRTSPRDSPPLHRVRNEALERQLGRLGIDEEFKESIRAMTPNTQREIVNDIVRQQQMEAAAHLAEESEMQSFAQRQQQQQQQQSGGGVPPFPFMFTIGGDEGANAEVDGRPGGTFFGEVPPQRRGATGTDDDNFHVGNPILQHLLRHLLGHLEAEHGAGSAVARAFQDQFRAIDGQIQQEAALRSLGIDRDVDDMTYEELLALEEEIGDVSKGLQPHRIGSCMKVLAEEPDSGQCAVCLEDWSPHAEGGDTSRGAEGHRTCVELNVCGHCFHEDCITQWLASNKTCPVCKQEVTALPHTMEKPHE